MKLPKTYEPNQYEADIYALWERKGAFLPKNRGNDDYFSIVMPPPNANANLHIGFGLTIAVEDTIVRYQRMQGKAALFVPGADHAGFETQVVYEKKLNQQGKSRFDYSREELYRQIWDFVEQNKHNFQSQIRALGASCDWEHFSYTLDNKVVAQAYKTFEKMWHEGLIYRGKRIVNYCTFHGTSFSDVEVIHEEETSQLWNIAYPLADGSGEVIVATTRPETMLGDTAVAVHPDDKRHKELAGKAVKLPLTDREVPIVTDEMVDISFGTGAVKVTPAHDPNDFEVAQRHNLPLIEVITTEGKTSGEVPKEFQGLSVLEAREKVAEALAEKHYLRGVESYPHTVGKCYKCGTAIEPLALEQWFVKMEPLAMKAIEALEAKKINFYPDSKRKQLIRYLRDLKDWNISRQIAWGIPIPAFVNQDNSSDWIFDTRVTEKKLVIDGKTYARDPDVFDTWFSSGSWPYVTLDYPSGEDFKNFYPTSLLETAGEILHQWVARMIMLGLYTAGQLPFKDVYIHGLVLAEGGAKMSKSLGNVVDAMEIIGTHGSDALRMGLLAGRAAAVNRGYDRRRVEEARNFSNKLWNIARYVEGQGRGDGKIAPVSDADHWILNKLSISAGSIKKYLDDYRLSEAYETLYHFVWDDLAPWYIEASKTQQNLGVLNYVLEESLKLAHPFAPFITETIWQTLKAQDDSLLAVEVWQPIIEFDSAGSKKFEQARKIIESARQVISNLGLKKPNMGYRESRLISENADLIKRLAKLSGLKENSDTPGIMLTKSDYTAWIEADLQTAKHYLIELERQHKETSTQAGALKKRLDNEDYIAKAPKELVDETTAQLEEQWARLLKVQEEIAAFKKAAGL